MKKARRRTAAQIKAEKKRAVRHRLARKAKSGNRLIRDRIRRQMLIENTNLINQLFDKNKDSLTAIDENNSSR